jgi:hypothetical protein
MSGRGNLAYPLAPFLKEGGASQRQWRQQAAPTATAPLRVGGGAEARVQLAWACLRLHLPSALRVIARAVEVEKLGERRGRLQLLIGARYALADVQP